MIPYVLGCIAYLGFLFFTIRFCQFIARNDRETDRAFFDFMNKPYTGEEDMYD